MLKRLLIALAALSLSTAAYAASPKFDEMHSATQQALDEARTIADQGHAMQATMEAIVAHMQELAAQMESIHSGGDHSPEAMLRLSAMMSAWSQYASVMATMTQAINGMIVSMSHTPRIASDIHATTTQTADSAKVLAAQGVSFKDIAEATSTQMQELKALIDGKPSGGSVDPGAMFELQAQMQLMSQFVEACSNVMSAIHQSMMSMAKAASGK